MRRRTFLAMAGVAVLAGCTDESDGDGPATEALPAGTQTEAPTRASTPEPTSTPTSEPSLQVRIIYNDEWSGALSYTVEGSSNTRSIDGRGSHRVDVPTDASIVSVNAQKQDSSGRELRVQILNESDVIVESSTTAEYGMAQVSESFF